MVNTALSDQLPRGATFASIPEPTEVAVTREGMEEVILRESDCHRPDGCESKKWSRGERSYATSVRGEIDLTKEIDIILLLARPAADVASICLVSTIWQM